jgi:hypothetical protein
MRRHVGAQERNELVDVQAVELAHAMLTQTVIEIERQADVFAEHLRRRDRAAEGRGDHPPNPRLASDKVGHETGHRVRLPQPEWGQGRVRHPLGATLEVELSLAVPGKQDHRNSP